MRYANETLKKANGIVYTPQALADYLSVSMLEAKAETIDNRIRILDPAIGDGELVLSLLTHLHVAEHDSITIVGFETNFSVIEDTKNRIIETYPTINIEIYNHDFIEYVLDEVVDLPVFDFIIANPPYIRTQIMGAEKAQKLSKSVGLTGRVDLYYAFLLFADRLLKDDGIAGFITSNKFMTIKAGNTVRNYLANNTRISIITDFGDTKLFNAAVLPCVIVFAKGKTEPHNTIFTSIYQNQERLEAIPVNSLFDVVDDAGLYSMEDGRIFEVKKGALSYQDTADPWSLSSPISDCWLEHINRMTWKKFSDIGKIRVGIKTTADNVFIKESWLDELDTPELLFPLITHRNAGQIVSNQAKMWKVLYTHTTANGKKSAVNISDFPNALKYLEKHRVQLEGRDYIKKAKRNWFEIWVPQNPAAWVDRKIVFRDIAETPQFWLDETGAIVNGDCYWIDIFDKTSEDELMLALAIANSKFIEVYYDTKFNNKLYAGKRRFMSQYVNDFPIPNPNLNLSQQAIHLVRQILNGCDGEDLVERKNALNQIVNEIFQCSIVW